MAHRNTLASYVQIADRSARPTAIHILILAHPNGKNRAPGQPGTHGIYRLACYKTLIKNRHKRQLWRYLPLPNSGWGHRVNGPGEIAAISRLKNHVRREFDLLLIQLDRLERP